MSSSSASDFVPVTVDKTHLITIGEKLYTESVELIRELVNNAYDADATRVRVWVGDDEIVVEDDGSGMDREGLRQYFTIGSPFKRTERKTPKFQRDRIGEFGIGKFSVLSACDRFEVRTQKGSFSATIVFDKAEWEKAGDHWALPMKVDTPHPASPLLSDAFAPQRGKRADDVPTGPSPPTDI